MITETAAGSKDSFLRGAIRGDSVGVGLIGVAIAALAGPFARMTGLSPAWIYGMAGAFIAYGVIVTWLSTRPRVRGIGTALSAFNFAGAAGQAAIVPAGVLPLTGSGKAVVLAFVLWTLVFGVLQLIGVRRMS